MVAKQAFRSSFARYLVVGILSFGIDYGFLLCFYHLFHLPLSVATTIGFLVGLTSNFLSNKYWSFNAPRSPHHSLRQAAWYGALVLANLLFTNLLVVGMASHGIGPEISKPVVTVLITIWNYFLYKKVIFKAAATKP